MSFNRTLWIPLSVGSVLVLSFFLSACGTSTSSVVPTANTTAATASAAMTATPVPASLLSEKIVRYILADSQLGNRIDDYRKVTDQPNAAEAVCRWDKGVRVQNIDKFERKVVGSQGWNVVYAGTDTIIDGMDVSLTSDVTCAATATAATATPAPTLPAAVAITGTPQATPTAIPAFEADDPQCQNSYWPILIGSHWEYKVTDINGKESHEMVSISKVWGGFRKIILHRHQQLVRHFYLPMCRRGHPSTRRPPGAARRRRHAGRQRIRQRLCQAHINGAASTKSDAGVFDTVGVCGTNHCEYYAENVGLISGSEKTYSKFLTGFLLPR